MRKLSSEELIDKKASMTFTNSRFLDRMLKKHMMIDDQVTYDEMLIDLMLTVTRNIDNEADPFAPDLKKLM